MNEEIINKNYTCLEDIATELKVSKNIVYDIANKRKRSETYKDSPYYPDIVIEQIKKEDRVNQNEIIDATEDY
tara:strand:- start:4781 stop:4999 length:219 start_codon:yes stop_codon:yes gene_type:complete